MDVHEVVTRGHDHPVALYCGKCGLIYRLTEPEMAEQCCKPYICKCGKPAPKGYTICDECRNAAEAAREKALYDKAKKISLDAYEGDWIYSDAFGNDGFGLTEEIEDELFVMEPKNRPRYAWACKPFGLKRIDAMDIIENLLEDHHEDAIEEVDVDGLQEVLDKWLKDQSVSSFEPDYSTAVLLDSALATVAEQEAEEAREVD